MRSDVLPADVTQLLGQWSGGVPGKLADLIILTADIMKLAEPEILKTTCAMTVIGGEIVYEQR